MPSTIKPRDDIDGCGCLDCQNIDSPAVRRTVPDTLVRSARLLRSSPSIVVAVFVLCAYVGTVVVGELTGNTVTCWGGTRRSLSRVPALVGVVGLAVALALVVPSVVSVPLTALSVVVSGNPVEIVGFPVVSAVGTLGFALPSVFLLVVFWFAPEACVIGRYGPIDSLRVGWRLTTDYRRKYPLVQVYGDTVLGPVLRALSVSIEEVLSVVWVRAYAHISVQEVIQL